MDARQIARMEAGIRINEFNNVPDNKLLLDPILNYSVVSAGIVDTLKSIKDSSTAQAKDISGIAPSKDELRVIMGDTILIFSQRGVVDATLAKNTELSDEVDHAITYYLEGKGSLGVSRANATVDLLETKSAVFASVSPANILTMRAAIAAFCDKKEKPTTERQEKKVAGTDRFDPLLDTLDGFITLEGNLIHSYFPKSKLAEGFDLTSKLIIAGTRHNPVLAHFVDAHTGVAIVGGILIKVSTGKTAISDDEGLAQFDTCMAGKQKFKAEAAGYVMQDIVAIIKRGVGVELVIHMVKIV